MHIALKNPLYKEAQMDLKIAGKVYIWTAWDDPTDPTSIGSEITNLEDLKRVFKYTYNTGWPIVKVATIVS